jgi:branched-chain amino acid transport system ATP-binding protein
MTIECRSVAVGYGALRAVSDINLRVDAGEVVALIGANGTGKTTILLSLVGELPLLAGQVLLGGSPTRAPLYVLARQGVAFIPEHKLIVAGLTVKDNLKVGRAPIGSALASFPELKPLLDRKAGLLSGGEQQILTLARALARQPKVVIVDELSLGLAPQIADRLARHLRATADQGTAVLVVEQNLQRALSISDRFYLVRGGRVEDSERSATYRTRINDLTEMLLSNAEIPSAPVEAEGNG